jgi:hypothetical protein
VTTYWEIRWKNGFKVITKPGPDILDTIKKGLEKGEVTVNGRKVKIIQRDGKDAWEFVPGVY